MLVEPKVLKISDSTERRLKDGRVSSFLSFDLKELVPLLWPEGEELHWAMTPMGECTFVTGEPGSLAISAEQFSRAVDESPSGFRLTWKELNQLSQDIDQTIWGCFIGVRDPNYFDRLSSWFADEWMYIDRPSPQFLLDVEMALQAVDSSFWLVYTRDDAVQERIREAFTDVDVITL